MPRRRDERGWVKKVGKTIRMWEGYFNVYVPLPDGTEKRRRRSRILGSCASMTKNEAMDELRKIIFKERGSATAVVEPVVSNGLPTDPTFTEVWQRYRTLKASSWSSATRKAVVSVFETAPPKEGQQAKPRRPSVLELIGARRVSGLTPDPIQQMLNNAAEAGYSYSTVKKARTYISAALEYAVGVRIIQVNPAARVELPGAKLRKPTRRSYSLEEMRRLLSAARSVSLREHLIVRIFYVCGLRPGELFCAPCRGRRACVAQDRRSPEGNGERCQPRWRNEDQQLEFLRVNQRRSLQRDHAVVGHPQHGRSLSPEPHARAQRSDLPNRSRHAPTASATTASES